MPNTPEQQNFANLVANTADPAVMTIDNEAIAKQQREGRAAQDAARPKEDNWRGELAELEYRLKGAMTEEQAKQHLDAITRDHDVNVRKFEKAIKELRELLKTPHLELHRGWTGNETEPKVASSRDGFKSSGEACGCDGCSILRKIETLNYKLQEARKLRERKIKIAGAVIQSTKELDKLRPRYRALKQREFEIAEARSNIKKSLWDASSRSWWVGVRRPDGWPESCRTSLTTSSGQGGVNRLIARQAVPLEILPASPDTQSKGQGC